MKNICILGSTGSIGKSTLQVVKNLKNFGESIIVSGLAANSNIELLEQQAKEFNPKIIGVYNPQKARELQKKIPHIPVIAGLEGLLAVASYSEATLIFSAMVGTIGLLPTMQAIQSNKDVALANKEALVSGGSLVMALAKEKNVNIIPVDSEHSAIFQCLKNENKAHISRIILTSSGGPFRGYTETQFSTIKVEDALKHPTWSMGPKITVDCSTLMNKGLEVIEAHWLFDVPLGNIEVVIHPQSVIHSLVEFIDSSMLAQMSHSSMYIPIQYAITHPRRAPGLTEKFNFLKYNSLEFYQPNVERFRCLQLAFDCLEEGGSYPCYLNAANEVLVNKFIDGKIGWLDISIQLEELLQRHQKLPIQNIDDVLSIDRLAREEAK